MMTDKHMPARHKKVIYWHDEGKKKTVYLECMKDVKLFGAKYIQGYQVTRQGEPVRNDGNVLYIIGEDAIVEVVDMEVSLMYGDCREVKFD